MKVNFPYTIIATLVAALLAYALYAVADGDCNVWLCTIGGGVCFAATLIPAIALSVGSSRLSTNLRVLSALFFVVLAVSNFCFAGFGVHTASYIIVNGVLLLFYLLVFMKMKSLSNI